MLFPLNYLPANTSLHCRPHCLSAASRANAGISRCLPIRVHDARGPFHQAGQQEWANLWCLLRRTHRVWDLQILWNNAVCQGPWPPFNSPLEITDIMQALSLNHFLKIHNWDSLVVQWLRLQAPYAGGLGSIPGQGTRSHMPQLKIPCPTTKIRCRQINKECKKKSIIIKQQERRLRWD